MKSPKYPQITIQLVGEDGNAFAILGRVSKAMKRNKIYDKWGEFHAEATSGNYDNLIMTVLRWFSTNYPDQEENGICTKCNGVIEDLWEEAELCDNCYDSIESEEQLVSQIEGR